MKYPNLAAEVEATGWHISSFADAAGVSVEVMRDILSGNEDLAYNEAVNLHKYLRDTGGRTRCSFDYLFAPVPAILRPGTNKTRYRRYLLREYTLSAYGTDIGIRSYKGDIFDAWQLCEMMYDDKPVRYADFRHSLDKMAHIVALDRHENRPVRGRDGEMKPKPKPDWSGCMILIKVGTSMPPCYDVTASGDTASAIICVDAFDQIPDIEDVQHDLVMVLNKSKEGGGNAKEAG